MNWPSFWLGFAFAFAFSTACALLFAALFMQDDRPATWTTPSQAQRRPHDQAI